MLIELEEAQKKLREGEFENAKLRFSTLLDIEPENREFFSGFFTASYWDNRLDKILSAKEGKERGLLLNSLFENFKKDFSNRGFSQDRTYESIRFCILNESCNQLRDSYLSGGRQILDRETLIILSKNLLLIGDYKNSFDLIQYFSKYHDLPPEYYFYRAECLYHKGETKKSSILFRSSFLYFPEYFQPEYITSSPILEIWKELAFDYPEEERRKEYLPVYCLERNIFPELEEYSKEEINSLYKEIERLLHGKLNSNPDVNFKIKNRILQFGITILDSFHGKLNSELCRRVREIIQEIDPELLDRREEYKKN
ncbi:MAG: hypothetical protein SFU98_05250 [Leptospiraceae bacterium]|nr:hypothetical protein [Leptospiraceae bacterium]